MSTTRETECPVCHRTVGLVTAHWNSGRADIPRLARHATEPMGTTRPRPKRAICSGSGLAVSQAVVRVRTGSRRHRVS